MISFKIGYNFDPALGHQLLELNERYGSDDWRVGEVYGSLASLNPLGTARPSWRLTDGTMEELKHHVKMLGEGGITVNYTINVSMVDPRQLDLRMNEIDTFLHRLQSSGVARVTVAHPLVGKIVSTHSSLPLELSTIIQVKDERQIDLYKERLPKVDKLCIDVFANRDFDRLRKLVRTCERHSMKAEVIVNEFCIHECIDRNQCYDIHSLNVHQEDRKLFNNYPMGNCMSKRMREPVEWLRARFILPQWVRWYHDQFGIESFKVTGRTHPTSYIAWVTEQYLKGEYDGNLLELWADVVNIGRAEEEYRVPRIDLRVPDDMISFYLDDPSESEETRYLERIMQ